MIKSQKARLGRLKLYNKAISEREYCTLERVDTVGERPRLDESPYYQELMGMLGLKAAKEMMTDLLNIQLQNYDSEMEGKRTKKISLHRLFLGNPGTGKTTGTPIHSMLLVALLV